MNTTDFWRMLRQGADTAGFWLDPGVDVQSGRALSAWGIPIRHTPNIASDTLVVGEFKSVKFYRGQGYRVDVSSEAGDRWDKNLTGFRGEEDIAFDARPAVYARSVPVDHQRARVNDESGLTAGASSRDARSGSRPPGVRRSGAWAVARPPCVGAVGWLSVTIVPPDGGPAGGRAWGNPWRDSSARQPV